MNKPITEAVKAGFPAPLIIGIAPLNASPNIFKDSGKTPAFHTSRGWLPAPHWQHGFTADQLRYVDNTNGNVGLRLGISEKGTQFLALDLDTDGDADPDSVQSKLAANICRTVIKTATERLSRQSIWVRRTRPDRATILFALKPDALPGTISTIHFSHPDGIPSGKMQVLAKGQQTVISGVHSWQGGTPIVWQEVYDGELAFTDAPYPPVEEIPVLNDRAAVDSLIDDIIFQLEVSIGLCCSRRKFSTLYADSGETISPEDQAAPNAEEFKELFATLPHGENIDREEWVKIMMAASGAIRAAKTCGHIDELDEAEMSYTVVDWSARWVGPHGETTDIDAEQDKWDRDFSLASAKSVGWQQLLNRMVEIDRTNWGYRRAQHEFHELSSDLPIDSIFTDPLPSLPPDPTVYQEPENTFTTGIQTIRQGRRLRFDVKKSEIQIADYIEERLKNKCAWVAKEKKWIMWSGPEVSWTNPTATAIVETEIQNQLVYYVAQHEVHFGNDDTARATLTSERTVRNINKLIQSRLTVDPKDLDLGDLCIQTPTGAWDLLTGKPFRPDELDRQVGFRDRRMASVTPKEGSTPFFDSLLEHIACGDREVVEWLWSYFGYALLGQPKLHILLIIHGPGGNGKGTIANVLYRLWGNYAVSLDRKVIVQTGNNDHTTNVKRADGKRLWLISELNPKEQFNESNIKSMSGGDMISARNMNQDMSEFKPQGSFYIYTQFVPALHRIDESIIRRFRMIHARIKVPDDQIDRNMEDKIVEQEGPAIMARLIKEAKAVVDRDWNLIKTPVSMQAEVKRYFAGQDLFAVWFSDNCASTRISGNESDIAIDILYDSYKRFLKRNDFDEKEEPDDFMGDTGLDALSLPAFTGALRRSGVLLTDNSGRSIRGPNGKAMARGVKLKNISVISEVA